MHPVKLAVLESAGKHLALHLVDCGELAVLFQIEEGGSASEGIETLEGSGAVKECDNLRAFDLVVEQGILLSHHESIGHQRGSVSTSVLQQKRKTVGEILPVLFVPDYRVLVESGYTVQVTIAHRVAPDLEVCPENLHIAKTYRKADLCSVLWRLSHSDGAVSRSGYSAIS